MTTSEDFISFGQGNVNALAESSQIVAAGLQDLSKMMTSGVQASMDETMKAFRALGGVRSLKEAIDLQATLARLTVEKTLTQTGQVAETSFKLAEQAFAPIAGRVTLAVQSFGKPA